MGGGLPVRPMGDPAVLAAVLGLEAEARRLTAEAGELLERFQSGGADGGSALAALGRLERRRWALSLRLAELHAGPVPSDGGPPVLVVDDDPDLRDVVSQVLERAGYPALAAGDGAEALRLAMHAARTGGGLRLVLLDLGLPRLGGAAFVEGYRALPGPHAPIVVMTAAPDAERWARVLGASGVLAKPFTMEDLLRAVGRPGSG